LHRQYAYPALLARFSLARKLNRHAGCVNTITWNETGSLLVSGSDDCCLCIWTVSWSEAVACLKSAVSTAHTRNIFCAKFVPESADSKVVTSALDGKVRLTSLESPAASRDTLLGRSMPFVSKFEFLPGTSSTFMTAGQDGMVTLYDLRSARGVGTSGEGRTPMVDLSSAGGCTCIAFDPCHTTVFCVGAEDPLVRTYDIRQLSGGAAAAAAKPLHAFGAPAEHVREHSGGVEDHMARGASGVAYTRRGELIVNMRGAELYRFDAQRPVADMEVGGVPTTTAHLAEYEGRANDETFAKEVCTLFEDAYVASGGDCGHVFVWDRLTGETLLKARGDSCIVNCVAPHPSLPLLAVSGIDSSVKLFTPGDVRPADKSRAGASLSPAGWVGARPGRSLRQRIRSEGRRDVCTAEEAQARIAAAGVRRERGNGHFRAGRLDEATAAYHDALEHLDLHTDNARAEAEQKQGRLACWLNVAAVQLQQEKFELAVEARCIA
jgi:WD repeat-containing protein 42A